MAQNVELNVGEAMESQSDSGEENVQVVKRHGNKRRANSESDSDVAVSAKPSKRNMTSSLSAIAKSIPPSLPLGRLNSLAVSRDLGSHLRDGVRSVKVISGGRLFITVSTPSQFQALLNIDKLAGAHVDITEYSPEEKSEGVISGVSPDITDEDLLSALSSYKVKSVYRFNKTKEGVKTPTYSVKLSFSDTNLPPTIPLGYRMHKVSKYVPPPLRCFKCQRFGHVADECRGHERCTRCGKNHDVDNCQTEKANFKCANCGGNHSAAYGGCPKMKEQAHINSVMVNEGVTRVQAKTKIVHSYANVVKKATPVESCPPVTNASSKSQTHVENIPTPTPRPTISANVASLTHSSANVSSLPCTPVSSRPVGPQVSQSATTNLGISSELLEKLILFIIVSTYKGMTNPVGDKTVLYVDTVKNLFKNLLDMESFSKQIIDTIKTIDG